MKRAFAIAVASVAVAGLGTSGAALGAVITPAPAYQPSDMTDFVLTGSGQTWTTSAGVWQDQYGSGGYYGGNPPYGAAVVQTSGVAGQNFTESTALSVTNVSGVSATRSWDTGLSLLGSSTQTAGSNSADGWYGATVHVFSDHATLDIVAKSGWSSESSKATGGAAAIPFWTQGNSYRLVVQGTYSSGQLTLTAELSDLANPGNSVSVSTAPLTPSSDVYFGYHDEVVSTGGGVGGTVQYSDFTLAVPEPASLSMLALGAMGLLARRRTA